MRAIWASQAAICVLSLTFVAALVPAHAAVSPGKGARNPFVLGSDRIDTLPGFDGDLPSGMYSGFMHADDRSVHHVHYLLVESERDPAGDPLVLWLNGGPGASALMGAFTELGPLLLASNETLVRNPFAWSKVANVLFIESPTGVGYSWCEAMKEEGGLCNHNDDDTAILNMAMLHQFVEYYHPEYAGRDFMIWGESYAGVYVPTLAKLVVEHTHSRLNRLDLNFLGFAVGDPCTDERYQHLGDQLHFNLRYAFAKGFVSADLYTKLLACAGEGTGRRSGSAAGCMEAWRMYDLATSNDAGFAPVHAKLPQGGFIDAYNNYGPNNHPLNVMLRQYLSQTAVKVAMRVDSSPFVDREWKDALNYTKQYWACYHEEGVPADAKPEYNASMAQLYHELMGEVRNIVVFNGDTDPDVQMRGTEAAVRAFGYNVTDGKEWRPWFYWPSTVSGDFLEHKSPFFGLMLGHRPLSAQLGGYVTDYEQGLSFVTVHTSGHMVPQYRPMAALHLFQMALLNKPLSPPLDMSAVSGDSDEAFYGTDDRMGYMGKWVALAQSSAYVGKDEMSSQDKTETH